MSADFVHLHVHSEFSLAEGLLKVKGLVAQSRAQELPAVALTDRNNLFALVKFYETCRGNGVKPIVGAELMLESGRVVALAMSNKGYKNLIQLVSIAYVDAQERGFLTDAQMFQHNDDIILL